MPTDVPPSYDTATHGQPAVQVTNPAGNTQSASADVSNGGGGLERSRTNETVSSISSDDLLSPGLVDEEGRKSMDDERRDLPDGWVRCFDPKSEHHFYVEEKTKRAIWIHPYDDPEFLQSLPDTHPAHPKSEQAQKVQALASREKEQIEARQKAKSGASGANNHKDGQAHKGEDRNWIQRKKDQIIGTKEERAKAKAEKERLRAQRRQQERAAEEAYLKRRRELIQKQLTNPTTRQYYASNPYSYAPPTIGFSRAGGMYGSPYGYGYGGGYGRRYGGMGYGGMGGMGMGLPLMGGLGGGLLLGSALGGGFGGGFGGGDFGGCGGGDMGGGGGGF